MISNPTIHRMGNTLSILCPRGKEFFKFMCKLVSDLNKLRNTSTELGSKETFLKIWNSILKNNGKLNIQLN